MASVWADFWTVAWHSGIQAPEVRELSRGSKSQPRGTLVHSSWGGAL